MMSRLWPFVFGLCMAPPAWSHDFWLQPSHFDIDTAAPDPMTIQVGHAQFRTRWSGQVERVLRFVDIGSDNQRDLRPYLKTERLSDAILTFPSAGTEVLAFESNHATSILPAIRFNDYIKFEGLTPALQLRAKAGKTEEPGREIYSRCAKAILRVGQPGSKPNAHVTAPVGLTLEIIPEKNPYTLKLGEALPVQVLYQGRPLAGATVMLTNLQFDAQPLQTRISDASGHASFSVPHIGDWLVNVLWTRPLQGNPIADFDTTFSSLTFGY